jgi:SAM-dependent methyltransferase
MAQILVWLALGVLFLTAYAGWRGAPWLPTPQRAVEAALDVADVGPGDSVVDLGAGDGRVLLAAARRGARAVGYELSPFFWALAWLRTMAFRRQVSLRLQDGFRARFPDATVVFAFLRPATMPRLAATLNSQRSRKNLRVIAYAFPLPERVPTSVLRLPGCSPVYLYARS